MASVVTVLLLAAGEGVAQLVERMLPPRTLPLPTQSCDGQCLEGAASLPPRPDLVPREGGHGWLFEPNTRTMQGVLCDINGLGLRGKDPEPRVPGELRLVSVGDSSAFGYGVEEDEVFLSVAAAALESRLGRRVTPMNAAIPGHAAKHSLAIVKDLGEDLDPDWLVITNIWSDLYHQTNLAPERSPSAAYRMAKRLLTPLLPPRTIGWLEPDQGHGQPGLGREPRSDLVDYQRNLHAMAELAEERGVRSLFLLLPAPMDLESQPVPGWIADYRAVMRGVAEDAGAPLVEGPEALKAADLGPEGFFDNVHPSGPTHRALGEALAEILAAELD